MTCGIATSCLLSDDISRSLRCSCCCQQRGNAAGSSRSEKTSWYMEVTQIIMSPLFCFPSSFRCWCCCKNEAVRHLGVDNLGTHHVSHVRGQNTAEAGKGHTRAHGRWPHNSWEDFRSVHVNGCKGNAYREPANHGKRHHSPLWNNNYDGDNYHIDDDGDDDDDDDKKEDLLNTFNPLKNVSKRFTMTIEQEQKQDVMTKYS